MSNLAIPLFTNKNRNDFQLHFSYTWMSALHTARIEMEMGHTPAAEREKTKYVNRLQYHTVTSRSLIFGTHYKPSNILHARKQKMNSETLAREKANAASGAGCELLLLANEYVKIQIIPIEDHDRDLLS